MAIPTPWAPVSLPNGLSAKKTRLHGEFSVTLGTAGSAQSAIFVRKRGDERLATVPLREESVVKDFEVLPGLGVFLLVAVPSAVNGGRTSWDDFQLLALDVESLAVREIYSGQDWDRNRKSFPVALIGSSPDGKRLALACGQHISPGQSEALDYRIGYLNPVSGELELKERLAGLLF